MKDDTTRAIKIPRRNGRPALDWEALYHEWLSTGKKKAVFLREKGINPNSGATHRNTNTWTRDTQDAHKQIKYHAGEMEKDKEKLDILLPEDPPKKENRQPQALPPTDEINEIWQIVQGWRKSQAASDYRVADNVKLHIKAILTNSVIRSRDENGKEKIGTTLKPADLRNIASCLEGIQKVQRLALGMSTSNIGVDGPMKPKDDIVVQDDNCPVFIVEINKNGKFERPRPTQVR